MAPMASHDRDDLELGLSPPEETDFRNKVGAVDLDETKPADKAILDELHLMNRWSGLNTKVVYSTRGTAAHANGFITLDEAELRDLFRNMEETAFKNALFFALAHEGGHHYQFKVFGVNRMKTMKRRELEAHADYLAGVWLALRLDAGTSISDDAKDAAMSLTGTSPDYPTAYQRMVLLEKGIADSAFVMMAENQAPSQEGKSLNNKLTDMDVQDSLKIAKRTLDEAPDKPRIEDNMPDS